MDPAWSTSPGDGDNDYILLDEHGVVKRRRIQRACDSCRRKKVKCDRAQPRCRHCVQDRIKCLFTDGEAKRVPPKVVKNINGLADRLKRVESLLRAHGLFDETGGSGDLPDLNALERKLAEQKDATPSATSPHLSLTSTSNITIPISSQPYHGHTIQEEHAGPIDALADQMCSLITSDAGDTRYIGGSSGFSIVSPRGIRWVQEKTGDDSFRRIITTATAGDCHGWEDDWKSEIFGDLFVRRIFQPLPPRDECLSLLHDFFSHFNRMFPLFHEPTFMHLVDRQYSGDAYDGSGWWSSLNVALAIAHRLRITPHGSTRKASEAQAWGFLKNAMAVLTELMLRNTDLMSVQALLGMALFLQGTPNLQPSFMLVAAAVRLSHSIGLHKRGRGLGLSDVEDEQRKRVFWISYLLDKDLCLRLGRPLLIDDNDINVELPSETPVDDIGNIRLEAATGAQTGKTTMNFFRLMCTFAKIQSSVYRQLYSVEASRRSDAELLDIIGKLDASLEAWKESIPLEFRPDHEINSAAHASVIMHIVILHFAYYSCVTTIHRTSVHHGYWSSRPSMDSIWDTHPSNPRVGMSAALCVNAARKSIALIRYIPQGDYASVWLILYYPVSALATLFANILHDPHNCRARSDLKLMSLVISFLTILEHDVSESNSNIQRMISVCAEFTRLAKVVLDKADRDLQQREKHKSNAIPQTADVELGQSLHNCIPMEKSQSEKEGPVFAETQSPFRRSSNISTHCSSIGGDLHSMDTMFSSDENTQKLQQRDLGRSPQIMIDQSDAGTSLSASSLFCPSINLSTAGPFPAQPAILTNSRTTAPMQGTQSPLLSTDSISMKIPYSSSRNDAEQIGQLSSSMDDFENHESFFDPLTTFNDFPMQRSSSVPQDSWQTPMTLEWDWVEGLTGWGSFTPGMVGMYDAANDFLANNGAVDGEAGSHVAMDLGLDS